MSTKQRIVSHLHYFRSQRLGHQNLLSGISHFILTHPIPNSSTFFVENPVTIFCLRSLRFFKFLQHRIFLLHLTNASLSTAIFDNISFTFRGLGFPCSRSCALVTAASTNPHSGFGSFGFLAPGTFPIIKSNRGIFMQTPLSTLIFSPVFNSKVSIPLSASFSSVLHDTCIAQAICQQN